MESGSSIGINDEIVSILLAAAGSDKIAEWNNFVESTKELIIKNYDGSERKTYKGKWRRLFKNNAEKLNLKIINSTTDQWTKTIVSELKEKELKIRTETTGSEDTKSTKSSTSSLNFQRGLREDDYAALADAYKQLTNKWKLKSGRCVEDILYEEAKTYAYEHPRHSYILSLDDDDLKDLFEKDELEEIIAGSGKHDLSKTFPDHLNAIVKSLDRKSSCRDIEECFMKKIYNRLDHPEEHWCVQSIRDYTEMFYDHNTVRTFSSEQTLFDEMYSFIKTSKRISNTDTEFMAGSEASSENKNMTRSISSTDKITRQIPGDIPDLVFKYGTNELGCAEIGLEDNGSKSTKAMNERMIKNPKMMRSFCWKIVNDYKMSPVNIKIVSFAIHGPHFTTSVMTFKYGSVGLLYTSPRMKMPTSIREVPRLLPPVLRLVYNSAQIIKDTVDHLNLVCEDEGCNSESWFPASFESTNKSNKRRKCVHPAM